MPRQLDRSDIVKCAGIIALAVLLTLLGCEQQQRTDQSDSLSGLQTLGSRIGPAQLSPERIQSEVDAYADRFVNAFSQAANELSRQHPHARSVLHTIKVVTASGSYTIAAGPNPVVALIDMIVQITLLRDSMESFLIPRLLRGKGDAMVRVLDRYEAQAWEMGERALTEQQRAEVRELIQTWMDENVGQVYVAGVRLSDFARLRPTAERQASSVFSLLRIDPFGSLDPATREIEEARLLTERIFFYAQRMPQLISWRVEQVYYSILEAEETEGFLANIENFTTTSKNMAQSVEDLRTLIPDQTAAAVREFSNALAQQREETVAALDSQQQQFSSLLDQTNLTIEKVQGITADVQTTLHTADDVGTKLQTASQAVGDAGRAWEQTIRAFQQMTDTLKPEPADADEPAAAAEKEPVEFSDLVGALETMQQTAVELRLLLEDINATAESDRLSRSVSASVDETRRGMQGLVSYIMWRVIIVIGVIVVAAIVYRSVAKRITH